MSRLKLAHMGLDSDIYNGHTNGADMLWAGAPVVTKEGNHWPTRVGAGLARAVGMPEMIVNSLEEYEELAVRLSTNTDEFEALRAKLSRNKYSWPLFDTGRWIRSLKGCLIGIWKDIVRNGRKGLATVIFVEDAGQVPARWLSFALKILYFTFLENQSRLLSFLATRTGPGIDRSVIWPRVQIG